MICRCFLKAIVGGLFVCTVAGAGAPETLYFNGGDRLLGFNRGISGGVVNWQLPSGTLMQVPLESVNRIEYQSAPFSAIGSSTQSANHGGWGGDQILGDDFGPPADVGQSARLEGVISAVCGAYRDQCERALAELDQWTRRIELGAQLRDGNSEEDFLNIGSRFEQQRDSRFVGLELGGQYGKANGAPTSNRWYGNSTIDVNRNGNWILFVTSKNEFDEFENLDFRGTLAGGLGYRFYNDQKRRLILRLGPGVTHERFHAPRLRRTTPDLLGEVEVRWPLFDRAELEHKTTVNPSLEDLDVFRLVSNHGVLVRLDENERWSLKLGLRHEYNSKPNKGRRRSDFTTLLQLVYDVQ